MENWETYGNKHSAFPVFKTNVTIPVLCMQYWDTGATEVLFVVSVSVTRHKF